MKPQVANIFPPEVRDRLIAASLFVSRTARESAVAKATQHARKKCPHLFRKEPE